MIPAVILWSLFGIVLFIGIFLKNKDNLKGDLTVKQSLVITLLALISGPAIWIYVILYWIYRFIEKFISSLLNNE